MREELQLQLTLPPAPKGLSTEPCHLVKPIGSLDAPLYLVSSYPTFYPNSSVQLRYGTIDDVSNVRCFTLLAKLGFHNATLRKSELLALKILPRQLDRKGILRATDIMSTLAKLPKPLRRF